MQLETLLRPQPLSRPGAADERGGACSGQVVGRDDGDHTSSQCIILLTLAGVRVCVRTQNGGQLAATIACLSVDGAYCDDRLLSRYEFACLLRNHCVMMISYSLAVTTACPVRVVMNTRLLACCGTACRVLMTRLLKMKPLAVCVDNSLARCDRPLAVVWILACLLC